MSSTMRVFNLTDVPMGQMAASGSGPETFVVGRLLLEPGSYGDTADDAMTRDQLAVYVQRGMASLGVPPPSYVMAKDRMQHAARIAAARAALPARK